MTSSLDRKIQKVSTVVAICSTGAAATSYVVVKVLQKFNTIFPVSK